MMKHSPHSCPVILRLTKTPTKMMRARNCKTPPTLAKRLLSKLMIVHMQGKGYAVRLDIGEHPIDCRMNDCTVAFILAIVVVRVDVICC